MEAIYYTDSPGLIGLISNILLFSSLLDIVVILLCRKALELLTPLPKLLPIVISSDCILVDDLGLVEDFNPLFILGFSSAVES
jgi:hypothetical protein